MLTKTLAGGVSSKWPGTERACPFSGNGVYQKESFANGATTRRTRLVRSVQIVVSSTTHSRVTTACTHLWGPAKSYSDKLVLNCQETMIQLFNEVKATQAAGRLLTLRGGRMSYVKLIKLLYLADREALIRWGRPITTDRYVSLDIGPVVSRIYDLIRDEPPPNFARIWQKFISHPDHYEVHLLRDPGNGELSRREQELIDEVYAQHGRQNRWTVVDYTRSLPEWTNPEGGALPIEYRDILRAANKTDLEISAVEEALETAALVEQVLV